MSVTSSCLLGVGVGVEMDMVAIRREVERDG